MTEYIIAVAFGLIIGILCGGSAVNDSIASDCKQMKQFRLSDKVFECKLVEKKND
jgi:hypothetical protein